jgi:methyl-accepting chemotaxis protein
MRRSLNISLVVGFVALLLAGVVFQRDQQKRVEAQASGHLKTMLVLRESVLRSHLESLRSEMILWSSQAVVVDLLRMMQAAFDRDGLAGLAAVGARPATAMRPDIANPDSESIDDRVARFAAHHGYYDIFIINTRGDVLYTVAKEDGDHTNLVDGPYADSGLGRMFRDLMANGTQGQIVFEDFSNYGPSNNEPAAFIGSRVYSDNEWIGVYAVQIPSQTINEIMQFSSGMGETGETYLVGDDGLMRSDSRFSSESSILKTTVASPSVARALSGEVGIGIVDDYRGIPVYSAYQPFDFEGTRWAVLAEQDVAEVVAPAKDILKWMAMGYGLIILFGLLLRFVLLHVVVPAALAGFLGLSLMDSIDDV